MYCKNCGTNLNEKSSFCPNCGTPVSNANYQQSHNDSVQAYPVQNQSGGSSSELIRLVFIILILGGIFIFSLIQTFSCKVYSCKKADDVTMADIMDSIDQDGVNIFPFNIKDMNDDDEIIALTVSAAVIIVDIIAGILATVAIFGIFSGKRKRLVKCLSTAIFIMFIGFAAISFLAIFVSANIDSRYEPEMSLFPMIMTVADFVLGIAGLVTSRYFSND